jgi:hypothetical protein
VGKTWTEKISLKDPKLSGTPTQPEPSWYEFDELAVPVQASLPENQRDTVPSKKNRFELWGLDGFLREWYFGIRKVHLGCGSCYPADKGDEWKTPKKFHLGVYF